MQKQLADVEVRRLDELYPDYQIDVSAEQDALSRADVIVWQFPFYWYSTPALFKKWIDDVHTHGFAYGSTGNKLHGKKLIVSFTTGVGRRLFRNRTRRYGIVRLFSTI